MSVSWQVESAIEWWRGLTVDRQIQAMRDHNKYANRCPFKMTRGEIEEVWFHATTGGGEE